MKQILIVEDDSFLNKMLDYNLTADGYGVTSALNARTAADAIRHREFDLVLLDINLPDVSTAYRSMVWVANTFSSSHHTGCPAMSACWQSSTP